MSDTPLKILLPCDGSPASLRAAELLAGYRADARRLAILVLNVQQRPVSLWPGASLDPAAVDAALIEAGQAQLEPVSQRLAAAGLAAQSVVRLGFPADAILREAQAWNAQAIVIGTRGAGMLQGFALGSVALRVAHGAAIPVMLLKPDTRLPAEMGRRLRVLLATDGSEPAVRAAARLVAWRDFLGELEVHLVYVQQPLAWLEATLPPHDDVIRQWSTAAGEAAAQAAREMLTRAAIRHRLHLTVGDPALEIGSLAEETASELLVLGTRGLGAAHHALVGSISLKVAARSAVPVALVR
jgi:nucleotide-binding universal stress UspA family protein